MGTIDSLPAELVGEVCAHLAGSDPATLGLVARVCRAFREPAQRNLFASVDLSDSLQAAQFLASAARARHRTRHLSLRRAVNVALGLQAIEQCGKLEGLGVFYSKGDGGERRWCASRHAAGIKELVVHYPDLFPDDETPIACELRYLELNMRDGLDTSALHSLTSSSLASLTTLCLSHLSQPTATQLTSYFTTSPLPNLHTLILETLYPAPRWPLLLQTFPAVTTLSVSARQTTLLSVVTALGPSASGTLRHLTLRSQFQRRLTPVQTRMIMELLRVIQLPNLSGLKRIELQMVSRKDLNTVGRRLLRECEARGIVFQCRYGYLTSKMLWDEPAIDA